jgi:endonuclease/exonuclease/phosphatase (EEP) superfamily protein YafD
MITYSLLLTTLLLALATLLPLWRHEAWWVRGLDFPRLQLAFVAASLLLIEALALNLTQWLSWGMISTAALCLAYQLWWITPYTALYPAEVAAAKTGADSPSLRIMTANVLTPNRNAAGLIQLVQEHQPHILVTLETDLWWQTSLTPLEQDYPYRIQCPLDNLYGMHLYSKYALSDSEINYLVEADVPSIHTLVTLPTGQQIKLHCLHPAPPSPTENLQSSERDAELIAVAKSIADSNDAVIVTGDLNDVAWSATTRLFRKISGLLDPRVGRGMLNTYHADYWFMRWPLDHLFHSHHFTVNKIDRLRSFGSDHFALFTELVYQPGKENTSQGLEADIADSNWADEKLQQQAVEPDDIPTPGAQP